MNAKLKKCGIDHSLVNRGWPVVRNILEREAAGHLQACIVQTRHLLEKDGARGEFSYSASILFDLDGSGRYLNQLPDFYEMPDYVRFGEWYVDIFAQFSIVLRRVEGFIQGTV